MLRLCAAVQVSGQGLPPDSGAGTISGTLKSGRREGVSLFSSLSGFPALDIVLHVTSTFLVSTCKVDREGEKEREKELCVVAEGRVCCVSLLCVCRDPGHLL